MPEVCYTPKGFRVYKMNTYFLENKPAAYGRSERDLNRMVFFYQRTSRLSESQERVLISFRERNEGYFGVSLQGQMQSLNQRSNNARVVDLVNSVSFAGLLKRDIHTTSAPKIRSGEASSSKAFVADIPTSVCESVQSRGQIFNAG